MRTGIVMKGLYPTKGAAPIDVEDTRREKSFNGRCPNERISLFNSLDCSKEMITLYLFKLFYQEG